MLSRFGYALFVGFGWLIARLPYRLMFVFADIVHFVLAYVLKYRKNVIETNLRNAFPEKTDKEIIHIRNKYYRHLADLFVENVALAYASKKKLERIVHYTNTHLLEKLYQQGRSALMLTGHTGNWEFSAIGPLYFQYAYYPVYKPLKNKSFDKFYSGLRARFGGSPLPMKQTMRTILVNHRKNKMSVYGIVADQKPLSVDGHIWTMFLNQETRVFSGPENIARKLNIPVLYAEFIKLRRGQYEVRFNMITENPKETAPNEITKSYLRALEQTISRAPAHWLWSHKRWKRKRNPEKEELV